MSEEVNGHKPKRFEGMGAGFDACEVCFLDYEHLLKFKCPGTLKSSAYWRDRLSALEPKE